MGDCYDALGRPVPCPGKGGGGDGKGGGNKLPPGSGWYVGSDGLVRFDVGGGVVLGKPVCGSSLALCRMLAQVAITALELLIASGLPAVEQILVAGVAISVGELRVHVDLGDWREWVLQKLCPQGNCGGGGGDGGRGGRGGRSPWHFPFPSIPSSPRASHGGAGFLLLLLSFLPFLLRRK